MVHHRHTSPADGNLQPASPLPAVLAEIVAHVATVVARDKALVSESQLREAAGDQPPTRGFVAALQARQGTGVIAEIKRQSPSAGLIRPEYAGSDFHPATYALQYANNGAAALSCLTEERYFGGHLSFVGAVRSRVLQPVLRKDFILSSYQVLQARTCGADAVLLMAECLPESLLQELTGQALALGLDVLVESHDEINVPRAWDVVKQCGGRALLGINNRNLATMQVDLGHTARMVQRFSLDPALVVAESGIRSRVDLAALADVGVRKVLVGEHLMRQASPGDALARLLGG